MNHKLTGGPWNLTIGYEQPYMDNWILRIYKRRAFIGVLKQRCPQDRHRLTTSVGPHRDDLRFFSDAMDLKKFGSQGQQRTAVLSLKLSELGLSSPRLGISSSFTRWCIERTWWVETSEFVQFIRKRIQTFVRLNIHDFKDLKSVQFISCKKEKVQYGQPWSSLPKALSKNWIYWNI